MRSVWLWLSVFACLSGCAHKAQLKTPTQIEKARKKAEERAAKEAKQKTNESGATAKPTPAPTMPAEDNQVVVP